MRSTLQYVVIQTLGLDFSPRVIFAGTTLFSASTRILVDAMNAAGVKRLITASLVKDIS